MEDAQPSSFRFVTRADDGNWVPWGLAAPDPFHGFLEGGRIYGANLAWEGDKELLASPRRTLASLLEEYKAAVAAVVDTGIHWLGWGLRAAGAYYQDAIFEESVIVPVDARYAVSRLAAAPAQAAGRYAAYCWILQRRAAAQDAAGAGFSLERFHRELLAHGARPLETFDALTLSGSGEK